ncbi:hypothetical protein QQF64_002870 [Cirrhinus molitorella]|uniref:Uncharacterized protein n=1 Tax=Cirrhinus molitorella TaxID=172907 RepID=A0ABR3MRD2_9TELE
MDETLSACFINLSLSLAFYMALALRSKPQKTSFEKPRMSAFVCFLALWFISAVFGAASPYFWSFGSALAIGCWFGFHDALGINISVCAVQYQSFPMLIQSVRNVALCRLRSEWRSQILEEGQCFSCRAR